MLRAITISIGRLLTLIACIVSIYLVCSEYGTAAGFALASIQCLLMDMDPDK
jgi:hypothetical protein